MKYMGSKNRYAKYLLPIILDTRQEDQWYVEPFCGGCNMIDKVAGNRIANDVHFYLIAMYNALVYTDWHPPRTLSNEAYIDIRDNPGNYPPELVGFTGFGCSYAGKWFGGYARGNDSKGNPRNYCDESRRNVLKQIPNLSNVIFHNRYYWEFHIPENSIVYCDPPYAGTTKYKDNFDHDLFWDWCRNLVALGHTVFVSEYSAPTDFVCVWSKTVNNTLAQDTGSKQGVERLFVHQSQLSDHSTISSYQE